MAEKKEYRIIVKGQLVPVTEEVYLAYYRMKRRESHLKEKDMAYGVFSYSALDTERTNGEDAIPDLVSPHIEDIVMDKLISEKLHQCLFKLTKEEQELIFALYFQNKSQHQYAKETGIPQMTICNRKDKIIAVKKAFGKIKNFRSTPLRNDMIPSSRTLKYKNLLGGIFMSRKSKIKPVEKVKIVEQYLRKEIGLNEARRLAGISSNNDMLAWVRIYEIAGPTGLLKQPQNQSYSRELKLNAVHDYLNGTGSLNDICNKYEICYRSQLRQWIKVYNTGRSLKESTGGASMRKARATMPEERLKIVKDCLANDKNYGAIAIKYSCSYQQVRNWVIKYEEMGMAGLEDRRGRRVGTQPSRTQEEELRDRIAQLEHKNEDLQMENDLLKKVRELERRDRYR